MDLWLQSALKSILSGESIFWSAAWFFVIILKFIFTSIFEIKIHEKNSLALKNFIFEAQFKSSGIKSSSIWENTL